MSQSLRPLFVILLLLFSVPVLESCSSKRQPTTYASQDGIERPARALDEEKGVTDQAGEILVAVLVVGGALAVIILPIVLLVLL